MAQFSFSARPLALIAAAFLLLADPLPAAAAKQAVTPEGVKRLETLFGSVLERQRATAAAHGAALTAEGPLLVEPADFYYAVTLPALSIHEADGGTTAIGIVSLNVMPGGAPDEWKMTLALPTRVVRTDAQGETLLTVETGAQNFAGLWKEPIGTFSRLDAQYDNISITVPQTGVTVSLPKTHLTCMLTPDGQGRWSGPAHLDIEGLTFKNPKTGSRGTIGTLSVASTTRGYAFDVAGAYREQFAALGESMDAGDTPSFSGAHALALYNLLTDFFGKTMDGGEATVTVKNVSLTHPGTDGAPDRHVALATAGFGFAIDGFRAGTLSFSQTADYDGLALTPPPAGATPALPARAAFRIGLKNLPYTDLVALGKSALQNAQAGGPAGKLAGVQAAMQLPQILTRAQSTLALDTLTFENASYAVDAKGALVADMNAAAGMTGTAQARITGLDALIGALKTAAADPDLKAGDRQSLTDTLSALSLVQMLGQKEDAEAENPARTYAFELKPDGAALLNGTDLKMILPGKRGTP